MLVTSFLEYLEFEKKYSKHTIMAYENDLIAFKEFCIENYEEDDLTSIHYREIRNWIVDLVNGGVSNRSVNRKVSSLKSFYNFLQKIEEIDINPLAKHKSLKVQKKINSPFTELEINNAINLIKEKDDFEGLRDRLVVELLYSTGIRRAELISLEEKNIDYVNNTIKVLGKRNKERLVVLLPFVVETIDSYLIKKKELSLTDDDGYLLMTKKGGKIYETLVYRIINSYFSRVSTKGKKSPHVLRHAFATHLLNNGASLNSVKELLGHSSLASTQVYTHNSLEQMKKVFNMAHPRGAD
ncbi:tyrosine-type recombinase/integrase [Tenacibaculum halocynthiae]|uniref:tyrosine-type recombinase/integrase n=1 Tax=Tenacibaculum halocynthiae TaxID=1254437 RepID=UPI003895C735